MLKQPKSDAMNRYEQLERRAQQFALDVIRQTGTVRPSVATEEIVRQLIRAAGSVGANYIEANEAISRKDFLYRVRISRKEAKEARHWLGLLEVDSSNSAERDRLLDEATQLLKIFTAIIKKSEE